MNFSKPALEFRQPFVRVRRNRARVQFDLSRFRYPVSVNAVLFSCNLGRPNFSHHAWVNTRMLRVIAWIIRIDVEVSLCPATLLNQCREGLHLTLLRTSYFTTQRHDWFIPSLVIIKTILQRFRWYTSRREIASLMLNVIPSVVCSPISLGKENAADIDKRLPRDGRVVGECEPMRGQSKKIRSVVVIERFLDALREFGRLLCPVSDTLVTPIVGFV